MKLHTIFSPLGERFEVTHLNFHDLLTHAGWTAAPPENVPLAKEKANANVDDGKDGGPDGRLERREDDSGHDRNPAEGTGEERSAELSGEADEGTGTVKPATEDAAARYAALDKPAMQALLKDQFGFDADGRWNLEKLVAKAVELEAAATTA